ncbi:adhesin, partial [Brenneria roseae subsp. roseae]
MGDATTAGSNAVAIGTSSTATGTNSISIGTGNTVSGNNSGAIGDPSVVTGTGSYSIGNDNTIDANNAFALGNNISIGTGLDGAVVLGDNSTVSAANATASTTLNGTTYNFAGGTPTAGDVVSVGGSGAERQITHVAAGQISDT